MLGTGSAGELARNTHRTLLEAARGAGRPAIEDWSSALEPSSLGSGRSRCCGCCDRRRFVNGARSGLRHHNAARRGSRWRWLWSLDLWGARGCSGGSDGLGGDFLQGHNRSSRRLRRDNRCTRGRNLRLCRGSRRSHWRLRCYHHNGLGRDWCLLWRRRPGRSCLSWRYHRGGLHHDILRRNYGHHRAWDSSTSWGLGHNSSGRWLGCDCRRCRRNNRRRWPRLRHNLARLRACGRSRRCCGSDSRRRRRRLHRSFRNHRWRRRFARWNQALASLCLLFLLFGQNGLHHVAWLGDVGKIDFRCDCLGCARR